MAGDSVDVVGSTPIAITRKDGSQLVVPLDAFQIGPAGPTVRAAWAAGLADETVTLLELVRQRLASGELMVPPDRPPRPALLVTAKHPGPESNSIVVHLTPGADPATDPVGIEVTQQDTFAGLTSAEDARTRMGALAGAKKATGLLAVKVPSPAVEGLPVTFAEREVPEKGSDVLDAGGKPLFTLVPAYGSTTAIKVAIKTDAAAKTFTVIARYDSASSGPHTFDAKAPAKQDPAIGYLVAVAPPPLGAPGVPAEGDLALSGGAADTPAAALAATS
ncbi:hypothetical protein [Actinoplanes sp. NPDC026619]|uniref:hypothetical protein n=1 Tax=Actinoplanes sp. NPDC026619 TaxID=3155798 RepID=UPI0034061409